MDLGKTAKLDVDIIYVNKLSDSDIFAISLNEFY